MAKAVLAIALLGLSSIGTSLGATSEHLGTPALKEVYSNFNSDRTNLYDCCGAWTISARDSQLGHKIAVGMAFTPAQSVKLRKIQLAIHHDSGVNRVFVSLRADKSDRPGDVIQEFEVPGLPPEGCCEVISVSTNIPLKAGSVYWVVVRPREDTLGGWNNSNTGTTGHIAHNLGFGWSARDTEFPPAFRVLGE